MRKIHFNDFWPGFEPEAFLRPLVEDALGCGVEVGGHCRADIHFTSVFPRRRLSLQRIVSALFGAIERFFPQKRNIERRRIWFTGENIRPPANEFDLTLSFDLDPFDGANRYLPLIIACLDWYGTHETNPDGQVRRLGRVVSPLEASSTRLTDVAERLNFACSFVGNPHPMRMRAIKALESVGTVDLYGDAVGRPVSDKISIAANYRFMLCFENDLYPGYVTEKPLDAWASGCIPLWWGIDQAGLLNGNAVLNLSDFNSLGAFVEAVRSLDADKVRMTAMGSEPLFREPPSLEGLKKDLRRALSSR